MKITISNEITIEKPHDVILQFCQSELTIDNPDYEKKQRLGLWVGNTPKKIRLYKTDGNTLICPIGAFKRIKGIIDELNIKTSYLTDLAPYKAIEYNNADMHLYDYQEDAVNAMLEKGYGILQSAAGSGKTQMGLAMIFKAKSKALWLTHTNDLLNQSYERACQFVDKKLLGKITGGKVQIGEGITFATVQTLSKQDMTQYKYTWDIVIADECFPCDALVNTIDGCKKIKDVDYGDLVLSFNHKKGIAEYKPVIHKFSKGAQNILTVFVENGKMVVTGNHEIFTQRGYVKAEDLKNGDYVLQNMWKESGFVGNEIGQGENLQKKRIRVLFERMFKRGDKATMDAGKKKKSIGADERTKQDTGIYKTKGVDEDKQSYEQSGNKEKGFGNAEKRGTQTASKRWKWSRNDGAAKNVKGCTFVFRCNGGICGSYKKTKRRVSDLLQDRFSNSKRNDCNRNRRKFPLLSSKKSTGRKENSVFKWVRVESVKVQKQTSDGTFGGLCSDGKVYNIGVEGNHNYFVKDILVHNCHRLSGSPTKMTQFGKVISNLAASRKYGLSATVHRADGLIKETFALIGGISHIVPESAVADKVMQVTVKREDTSVFSLAPSVLDTDGTIIYSKLISWLSEITDRNNKIAEKLTENMEHYNLVLSDRLDQLRKIIGLMPDELKDDCVMIDGSMTSKKGKAQREQAIDDMRNGKKHFLFASYRLAKEGLDIPRLDRLHLATPQKDYAIIVQSVGRIARTFPEKEQPICYDYVDKVGIFERMYKQRCTSYRKCGCIIDKKEV